MFHLANQNNSDDQENQAYDILIVGAGPSGLSAAIRLKQNAIKHNINLSVAVLEKGTAIGSHVVSGAVIDPIGLDMLFEDWQSDVSLPPKTAVINDEYLWLWKSRSIKIPNFLLPKPLLNRGNVIMSLSEICRWLAQKAEEMGVEIYPGFVANQILYEGDKVVGVATGAMGIKRDGTQKSNYEPGIRIFARYTMVAEGARGSLAKELINRYDLASKSASGFQVFGLGLKELWEIDPKHHRSGCVQHSLGWPLEGKAGGGGFLYHFDDNGRKLLSLGMVVHLDYQNPYLDPFLEMQSLKTHPSIAKILKGGKCLSYGARVISEGGYQSVPGLVFPGGLLLGCAAGFVNVPRLKGSHNAIISGILAADAATRSMLDGRQADILTEYESSWNQSPIGQDLFVARNMKPLIAKWGTIGGSILGGFDMWTQRCLGISIFGTMQHIGGPDYRHLRPAANCDPIEYPRPDGILTFDRSYAVSLSAITHDNDQPPHLKIQDILKQNYIEHDVYAGLSARYCPAGVYDWIKDVDGSSRLMINAQNCIHCKACDIKDPLQNIVWTPPEGGSGPNYSKM